MGPKTSTGTGGNLKYLNMGEIKKDIEGLAEAGDFKIYSTKKVDGKYIPDQLFNEFEGILVGIFGSTYKWEGKDVYQFIMFFDIEEDYLYKIEANMSYPTRAFVNAIASITDFSKPLRFWTSYYEGFWGINLQQDGFSYQGDRKTVHWKYPVTELKPVTEYEIPGEDKPGKSYVELNKQFIEIASEINGKLTAHPLMPANPVSKPGTSAPTVKTDKVAAALKPITDVADHLAKWEATKKSAAEKQWGETKKLAMKAAFIADATTKGFDITKYTFDPVSQPEEDVDDDLPF